MESDHSDCPWFHGVCGQCHGNACPKFFGGNPEVPCGHGIYAQPAD